jgi:protoheme IX farnesyltransferase
LINQLQILSELTKIRITVFVSLTTVLGYISFTGVFSSKMILPTLGILLLACGSAVLNHYQERNTDALMRRTQNRPLPSGKIEPGMVVIISSIFVIIGSVVLYLSSNFISLLLGLLNLVWYNLVYTPLKKVTPLAIVPGSLVGAIPLMVGWTAAGGYLFDPQILVLAFFFFIWQIPHFWLLLLNIADDYLKAGFPTLTQLFKPDQLARITFVWILATIVSAFLIPFFGVIELPLINYCLVASGVWFGINSIKLIQNSKERLSINFAFRNINLFALSVVLLVSIDKVITNI